MGERGVRTMVVKGFDLVLSVLACLIYVSMLYYRNPGEPAPSGYPALVLDEEIKQEGIPIISQPN
jgi:hypothetical protein